MDTHCVDTGVHLRQIAGYLRLLGALANSASGSAELDRRMLPRLLKELAATIDKVASETERCRECPTREWKEDRL